MELVNDPEGAAWLGQFSGEPDAFEWDAGNRTKNRKHGVELDDVAAMFQHDLVFLGRIVTPAHNEERWLALGQDARGRRLALVFTRRGQRLRPVSCRPMRRDERRIYEEAIQQVE
jgi:uncharacterized DUF497 family protein